MKKYLILSAFVLFLMVSTSGAIFAAGTPSVKIMSPVTGSSLETGDVDLTWSSKNISSDTTLSIMLIHKDMKVRTIRTKNDGNEKIQLPLPGQYTVKIVNNGVVENPTVYDKATYFANTPNNEASCSQKGKSSVTVLSPNGGQLYEQGQEIDVLWSSCNILPSTLMVVDFIALNKNGTTFTKYMKTSPNTGSTRIKLPTFEELPKKINEGPLFMIKVRRIDGEVVRDFSDGYFSIINDMPVYGPIDIDL
jgi:hypothetical protein